MKLLERFAEIEEVARHATRSDDEFVLCTLALCLCTLALCRVVRVLAEAVEAQQRVLDYAKIGEDIDVNELVRLARQYRKAHEKAMRFLRGEEATD